MRGKLKNAGIRKKLVCYSYAIITPILMLISTCLFVRNYHRTMAEERELCQKDVENLSGNLDTLLDGMVEFGTYICINNDILAILSSERLYLFCMYNSTAGSTPQLPQVGAVTTVPLAAFCSAAAKA